MHGRSDSSERQVSRRAVLASTVAGVGGLSGCLSRFRTVRNQDVPEQISLDVLTLPGDDDAVATQIGRRLTERLEEIGVDADLLLYPEDELRRTVLINRDYDLFVTAHPFMESPDTLRPLLHSSFVSEVGWQNPFQFTHIGVDELLEAQQFKGGSDRRDSIVELQREIAQEQPFVPIAVPDTIRATRSERFSGWRRLTTDFSQALAGLERVDEDAETLSLVSTDGRLTGNLNPIAIEYRNRGQITSLLYDSLGRHYDGEVRPWMAADWEISAAEEGSVATVSLRDGLEFHDGRSLTADDIVFTVEFLQDTSLGSFEVPVPAPRFRGRSSLIEEITAVDERTLEMRLSASPEVAVRVFTVPIFPRQDWEDRTEAANIAGVEISETVTEALVSANEMPAGSGLFKFESNVEDEELVLERNDAHFLNRDAASLPSELADRYSDGIPFERVEIRVVRSDDAALRLLVEGEVDATLSSLKPTVVPRIGREPDVDLHVERSQSLYLLGCNTGREPLGNPHFRRLVARLINKEAIQHDVFGGFASPAASPLTGTEYLASDLRWNESDPVVPFFGTGDELDTEGIRTYLRDAGFEFSDEGELFRQ